MPRTIEKAFYASSLRAIRGISPGYSRVYFGAEFCQWRMPSRVIVEKAFTRASEMGLGFTLLTPWVTDAGMKRLEGVLAGLASITEGLPKGAAEVVVNDFGVFSLIKKFGSLTPVLGRLLSKQKRCPRIPGIVEGLPEGGRLVYMGAWAEDPVAVKFLKGLGIRRVELDNPLQGLQTDLRNTRLKGTIYTPYAYVTTTRHCPASFDGAGWQAFTGCRTKACLGNVISLKNPAHGAGIIMRGNTQFVENVCLPENLSKMGIDRVVYMEDVP